MNADARRYILERNARNPADWIEFVRCSVGAADTAATYTDVTDLVRTHAPELYENYLAVYEGLSAGAETKSAGAAATDAAAELKATGAKMQADGVKIQAAGEKIQAAGVKKQSSEMQAAGAKMQAAGAKIQAAGAKIQSTGATAADAAGIKSTPPPKNVPDDEPEPAAATPATPEPAEPPKPPAGTPSCQETSPTRTPPVTDGILIKDLVEKTKYSPYAVLANKANCLMDDVSMNFRERVYVKNDGQIYHPERNTVLTLDAVFVPKDYVIQPDDMISFTSKTSAYDNGYGSFQSLSILKMVSNQRTIIIPNKKASDPVDDYVRITVPYGIVQLSMNDPCYGDIR